MLGFDKKYAALALAVCLVFLLVSALEINCSAQRKKPSGAIFDDSLDKVNWTELNPSKKDPTAKPQRLAQSKRRPPSHHERDKWSQPKTHTYQYDDIDNADYNDDEGISGRDGGDQDDNTNSQAINRNISDDELKRLDEELKKMGKEVDKIMKDLKPVSKTLSRSPLDERLFIIGGIARDAICIAQLVLSSKADPSEWQQKCCPSLLLRIIASAKCRGYDPRKRPTKKPTSKPTQRPPKPSPPPTQRPTTKRPKPDVSTTSTTTVAPTKGSSSTYDPVIIPQTVKPQPSRTRGKKSDKKGSMKENEKKTTTDRPKRKEEEEKLDDEGDGDE